jgi:ribonuclease D
LPFPIEIVVDAAQLDAVVNAMSCAKAIAFDTESNSLHHYPEQLCLIQIAANQKAYIIDMITLRGVEPLRKIIADESVMKVIHGSDYDIRSLDRHYGLRLHGLYDTHIAARFAGMTEVGLAALITNLLGVSITKSKALQTADWGRRPLSAGALEYAAADVFHLLTLQKLLSQKIQELGRTAWVTEECARLEEVRYTAPDMENAYRFIKGADTLDNRGLAVLRSLVLFREEEAVFQHRPPFFIIPDGALIALAACPTADISGIPGLRQAAGLPRFRQGLQQALRKGLAGPPIKLPPPVFSEPMSREQLNRLTRLKAWRTAIAAKLVLDPSLLWPTPSLQRLARAPDTFGLEMDSANVRRWQKEQFAAALKAFLETDK